MNNFETIMMEAIIRRNQKIDELRIQLKRTNEQISTTEKLRKDLTNTEHKAT